MGSICSKLPTGPGEQRHDNRARMRRQPWAGYPLRASSLAGKAACFCRTIKSVVVSVVFFCCTTCVSLAADTCPGSALQHHPIRAGENFDTNSRLSPPFYYDCVVNLEPSSPIRVDWYSTALHGIWLQSPQPLNEAPRIITAKDLSRVDPLVVSCIEYGLVGKTTTALLLGIDADVAGDADHKNCSASASKPSFLGRLLRKLVPVAYDLIVTVPSNAKSPGDSLITMRANVSLHPLSETSYRGEVSYELSKDGEKADLGALKIRPTLQGEVERLSRDLAKAFPNGTRALAPGALPTAKSAVNTIPFEVDGGNDWQLVAARFEFVDRENSAVAAVDLPLYVPAK
jgi:hypothetical protein